VYREIWADRKCEKLQNPSSYNEGIRKSWMPFWTKNAAENYGRIKEVFMKENRDASILFKREHPDNVLLIGSGPSLNDWEPYFKEWKGDIICSSSHLAYFEALGITPTFCFIIDADPNMSFLVSEADTKNITLVTHPNMDPVILASWKGPVIYFRMHDPGDPFFSEVMPMVYADFLDHATKEQKPGVRSYVLNSGNVTNCQLAMANYWQYKRSFLCGVDLGFPKGVIENQYRFVGYKRTKDGFEREEPTPIPKERVMFKGGNNIKTDQVSCFYKYSTMILWGMDNANIYSCSRGILREIPYISPAEVVACQGNIPASYEVPNEIKYKKAQQYLTYRGIYIMKGKPQIVYQKKTKDFERIKKRLMRYQILITKIKRQYNEQMRKYIIHTMSNSPALKFRFYFWEWTWTPEQTTMVRLSYTAINNKYSVKGWKRFKLMLRFYAGKALKYW